jgi:uncharacterized membrane protein
MTSNPYPHIFSDPEPAAEVQHPFAPLVATQAPAAPRPAPAAAVPARQPAQPIWLDFGLVLLICLLLAGMAYLAPPQPALALARLGLALVFVLIVPGYSLAAALFPRRDDLEGVERAGISLGLSVALAPVVALVLDRTGLGLDLTTILSALVGLSLALMALALILRARLPGGQAYAPGPAAVSRIDWWAALLLVLVLAAALGVVAWLYTGMLNPPKTTEFYLLGAGGLAEDYPRQAAVGQALAVTVGIASHEAQAQAYAVEVRNQGDLVGLGGPFLLQPGETLQVPLEFYALHAGDDQAFTFLLVGDNPDQPERVLELWLDVDGPSGE